MLKTWCIQTWWVHLELLENVIIEGLVNESLLTIAKPSAFSQNDNFRRISLTRFEVRSYTTITHRRKCVEAIAGDRGLISFSRTPILKTMHIDPCQESTKGVKQFHSSFRNIQRRRLPAPSPCWKHLIGLSHLKIYWDNILNRRTEPLWSPEIGTLVYKDLQQQQLTKILFKMRKRH